MIKKKQKKNLPKLHWKKHQFTKTKVKKNKIIRIKNKKKKL